MSDVLIVDDEHPYLGLRSFLEAHERYFHGRKREVDELHAVVARATLTVLHGKSGLGKTSLLHAGLFPRLRGTHLPILVRPKFGDPTKDLLDEVVLRIRQEIELRGVEATSAQGEERAAPPGKECTLWRYFHETSFWDDRNNLLVPVLVFDQFEEIFTVGRERRDLERFWTEIGDLAENRVPAVERARLDAGTAKLPRAFDRPACKVILTLREEYFAQLNDERRHLPSVAANCYRLKQMDGLRGRDAVFEPGTAKRLVEKDVATKIVWIVTGKPEPAGATDEDLAQLEVEPALLSVVCCDLNTARIQKGAPAITTALLEIERTGVIERFYTDSTRGIDRRVCDFIQDQLLTEGGFRTPFEREEAEKQPGVTKEVLETLIDRRLLREEHYVGRPHIEIVHDVVAKVIAERRAQRRRSEAEEQRRREAQADTDRQDKERRDRRKKWWWVGAGLALGLIGVVIVGVTWWADDARRREVAARTEAENARAAQVRREGARQSEVALTEAGHRRFVAGDLEVAGQFLAQAHASSMEAGGASPALRLLLTRAFQGSRGLLHVLEPRQGAVRQIRFQPDGKRFATLHGDGSVTLWDVAGGTKLHTFEPLRAAVNPAGPSPRAPRLGSPAPRPQAPGPRASEESKKLVERVTLEQVEGPVAAITFSPKRDHLAALTTAEHGLIWDTRTHLPVLAFRVQRPGGGDQEARFPGGFRRFVPRGPALVFSPDGSRLAMWSGTAPAVVLSLGTADRTDPDELGIAGSHVAGGAASAGVEDGVFLADGALVTLERASTYLDSPSYARRWSRADGKLEAVLDDRWTWSERPPAVVRAIASSADGKRLAVLAARARIHVWNEGSHLLPARRALGVAVQKLRFDAGGTRLAVFAESAFGESSGTDAVVLWKDDSLEPYARVPWRDAAIAAVTLGSEDRLVTVDKKQRVQAWDSGGHALQVLPGSSTRSSGNDPSAPPLEVAPDGSVAVQAMADGSLRVWRLDGSDEAKHELVLSPDTLVAADSLRPAPTAGLEEASYLVSEDGRWFGAEGSAADGTPMVGVFPIPQAGAEPRAAAPLRARSSKDESLVAVSPDGHRVVLRDGLRVRLLDLNEPNKPVTFQEPESTVLARFSPDGSSLVVANAVTSGRACVVQPGSPTPFCGRISNGPLSAIAWSGDGQRFSVGDEDGGLWILDVQRRGFQTWQRLPGGKESIVDAISLDARGARLVAVLDSLGAMQWEAGRAQATPLPGGEKIKDARFSPGGERLLVASGDMGASLQDLAGKEQCRLPSRGAVSQVSFSPDGSHALTRSGKRARLWRIPAPGGTGECALADEWDRGEARFSGSDQIVFNHVSGVRWQPILGDAKPTAHVATVTGAAFVGAPDAALLVTADEDGVILARDYPGGALREDLGVRLDGVEGGWLLQAGSRVVAVGKRGSLHLWEGAAMSALAPPGEAAVRDAAVSSDGWRLALLLDEGGKLRREERSLRREADPPVVTPVPFEPAPPDTASSSFFAVSMHDAGPRVVVADAKGRVMIRGTDPEPLFDQACGHQGPVTAARLSADATRLVTGGKDGKLCLWDLPGSAAAPDAGACPCQSLEGHRAAVRTITFGTKDGVFVATGDEGGGIHLWTARGEPAATLPGITGGITSIHWGRGFDFFVAASGGSAAWLADARTGRPLAPLPGNPGEVRLAVFDPTGDHVVTAGEGGSVRVWDTRTPDRTPEEVRRRLGIWLPR